MRPGVKLIIASHKRYRMPADPMYLPLQVGAEGKADIGMQRDDEGENISGLNPYFCELTGTYWAWKNLDAEYIGTVHYRRHFSMHPSRKDPYGSILKYSELKPYLGRVKVFVPKKRHYLIETIFSHYSHTQKAEHLLQARQIIKEKTPEYTESFDKVMRQRSGYMFNMMIMERELLDRYCRWLFCILFELKDSIGDNGLTSYEKRFYGRVAERLFNVWLQRMLAEGSIKRGEIKELPVIRMERTDWIMKIIAFLKAKYMHIRYDRSY